MCRQLQWAYAGCYTTQQSPRSTCGYETRRLGEINMSYTHIFYAVRRSDKEKVHDINDNDMVQYSDEELLMSLLKGWKIWDGQDDYDNEDDPPSTVLYLTWGK
jgi:hypothetical protein